VNATSTNPSSSTSALQEKEINTSTKPNTSTSKIGGWLPKWHRNGSGSNHDFAAKSKLQAILHEDVTKHAKDDLPQTLSKMIEPRRRDASMLRDITSKPTVALGPSKQQQPPPPPPRAAGVNQPGGLALFLQQAREHELHSKSKQTQTQTQARSISAPTFFPSMSTSQSPTRSIRSTRLEDSDVDEDALAECLAEVRSLASLTNSNDDEDEHEEEEQQDEEMGNEKQEISTDLTFFPRVQGEDWASFDSISRSPSPPPTSFAATRTSTLVKEPMNKKCDNAVKNQHQHPVVVVRNRSLKKSGWRSVSGGGVMGR